MSGDAMRRVAVDLRGQAASLPKRASIAVRTAAFNTEADAKVLAPYEFGNLQGSIQTVISDGGLTAHVIATASYAIFQEMGTSKMRAQPFMGPATDRNTPAFRAAMAQLAEGA